VLEWTMLVRNTVLWVDLRRLEYFVAVAEELHFGRAAERLHVAQPPLSRQIQRLEAELGVQLFVRDRHGVALTEAGTALLPEAVSTLAQAERAAEIARRAARGESGVLDVGFFASIAFSMLPELARGYAAEHPRVELRLHDMSSGEQLRALRAGHLDVGLMMQPGAAPDLNIETIRVEPAVLVVADDHALARQATVSLSDLEDERFALFPREQSPDLHDRLFTLCQRAGFTPRVSQEATHMATIVSLVAAGVGVSVMPASITHMGRPDIACIPLCDPSVEMWTAMAWSRGGAPPALPAFLDRVREVAASARVPAFGRG
jgi:DNA-binding transcriptional LysR family regulator